MAVQAVNDSCRSLWRERANQWLQFAPPADPVNALETRHDDPDHNPPPAAPAMRPWPRVFPGL